MNDALPEDARRLLEGPLDSCASLLILMTMREHSERGWSEDTLRSTLQVAEGIPEVLRSLEVNGLVRTTTNTAGSIYTYAPKSAALEAAVAALARVYRERPTVVIQFISANAVRRVRKSALRAFADAVIRRRK